MSAVPRRPMITVLTDPLWVGSRAAIEAFKAAARVVRDRLDPPPEHLRSPYRGHFAVTRSVVEGLRKLGVPANYNPRRVQDVAETVVVLSGLGALEQAVALKRQGRVRFLLAGPNIVVFPSQARGLLSAPEVDVCLVPVEWVRALYLEDCPALEKRCRRWPAGVDTEFWTPSRLARASRRALVYVKAHTRPTASIERYAELLVQRGYAVDRLDYGTFTPSGYRERLRRCGVLVGFSGSESQGLAWAEAWSVNVPTLLWFQDRNSSHGRWYASSTAPYLTDATGRFFRDPADFLRQLEAVEEGASLAPRAWVLHNMSDEVCARRLCELAGVFV